MMSIQELDNTPEARRAYDRLVDLSPAGSLYCRTWWLDAVALNQYTILTLREGENLQAAWPLVSQDINGRTCIGMPPLTQKLGVLLSPSTAKYAEKLSQEHAIIEGLIQRLPADTAIDQHLHESLTNWLPFYWNGFQQTTRYTYLVPDLKNLDSVWKRMRTAARTGIRNASKRGVRVREARNVAEVFGMYAMTMKRQGMPILQSLEQVERLDEACARNAGRLALIAEDAQGRVHAAVYLVYDARCSIYLLGGADPDLRNSGAQTMLLWEAITFASRTSETFDFEGSMIRGVEAALRDLGGMQTPYSRIWRERCRRQSSKFRRLSGRVLRKLARLADPVE
jgi:hypothetical protein